METTTTIYTASRIAFWLERSAQAVRKSLREIEPGGVKMVNGIEAEAWEFSKLPESFRAQLSATAKKLRFLNVETMLANHRVKWEPSVPLDRVSEVEIKKARLVREALTPWLIRQHDLTVSSCDFVRRGAEDYRRIVGDQITSRWWRELFERTIRRDGGLEKWERLALYLPERPALKRSQAETISDILASEFSRLSSLIEACSNPANPKEEEKRTVWRETFEEYDRLVAVGAETKTAARRLRDLLIAKAPFTAPSRDALRKTFDRKLSQWLKNKDADDLEDQRKFNGDSFVIPQDDLDLVESLIVFQCGQYDPAWKRAWKMGKLSEVTRRRYARNMGRYCPDKFKRTLGERPLWLYVMHRRRKDFNSMKAHFTMIYDGLHTLDCISADDVTLPVWFWYQANPNERPIITRGQCLVFIDLVSKKIVGWSLQPDRNYNARVIYTETTHVFAEHGQPKFLLFERGIWKKAKLIAGSAPHSIIEVTEGLRGFGVELIHACSPEGKTEIENVMGLIQNLMEGEKGYAGRDERKDRPDWIKKQLAELQSASGPHPSKYFHSFEEWDARLREIFDEYNETRQYGKHNHGKTPDEIWVEKWNLADKPGKYDSKLRYLLAHARYEITPGPDGFEIGSFKYFGEEIARFVGYPSLVWFNPECPDVAIVTDMKRQHPTAIPLHPGVPRLERLTNPGSNILSDACARREGQVKGMVARYNVLKSKVEMPYRKNLVAPHQIALGQQIEAKTDAIRSKQSEKQSRLSVSRNLHKELGVPLELATDDPEQIAGLERLRAARMRAEITEESL